jgi:hypothetical protein
MEPLPIKPTQVPQARRYTRKFVPNATKLFQSGDTIIIDIPPIKNTYLTKNARLHFTMNMEFVETTKQNQQALLDMYEDRVVAYKQSIVNYFQNNLGSDAIPLMPQDYMINMTRKPVPMLDICGPYGFFRKAEVYDYLGNTLLENIDRHDLLASQMADFYLDHEVDRMRPYISDDFHEITSPIYPKGTYGGPPVLARVNGIPLLDPDGGVDNLSTYQFSAPSQNIVYNDGTETFTATDLTPHVIPPWQFSIDLLTFLGRGSSKFVPLHNGYRLVFHLNDPNVPIKFSLPVGGLTFPITYDIGENKEYDYTMEPTITLWNVQAPYLRAELLEVTPELDSQVEKIVHATMRAYVLKGKIEKPTILPGNYLSAKNITVSFRHLAGNDPHSELGFRSRCWVQKARLLYDDAVQQELGSVDEIRLALGETFNSTITKQAFAINEPNPVPYFSGSGGYMYPYPTQLARTRLSDIVVTAGADQAGYFWYTDVYEFYTRYNNQEGRFLIKFDLDLLGYGKDQIAGLDLTKTTVKLDFTRDLNNNIDPYETDIFTEYDAIVTIQPDKYCSVSF